MDYTINVRGHLQDLSKPQVMGIMNVTPESFYANSRRQTEQEIAERVCQIVSEGAAMIDIGGCSTRPGADLATEEQEMERLRFSLGIVRREQPDAVVSVDTFRPNVARMAVEEFGADIINDVGAPAHTPTPAPLPSDMFRMVSRLRVPYILMSSQSTIHDILLDFAEKVQLLRDLGQKDIILDPGFGFGKTLNENYQVLSRLEQLQVMELPLLVGVSRKSMIYQLLETSPDQALNGTTTLNAIALTKGATILRVHDVKEAVECIKLTNKCSSSLD
jgi:dihydropteroate synthase